MARGFQPKSMDHFNNPIVNAQGDPVQTPSGTNPFWQEPDTVSR